nr:MAG: putative polyprotein [Picornavirales sp.]
MTGETLDSDLLTTTESSDSSESEDEEFVKFCNLGEVRWIVSAQFCKHTKLEKCPCMASMRLDGNKAKYHFDEKSLNDLAAIAMELRLRSFSFRAGKFDALDHYRDHFVTKIACTTKNRNLSCDAKMDRSRFIGYIWELREAYLPLTREQSTHKFGHEECREAQDEPGFFVKLFDKLKSICTDGAKSVRDIVKAVFTKFISWLKMVADVISETCASILDKFFNFMMNKFVSSIDVLGFINDSLKDKKVNTCIVLVSFILVVVVIDILGILAYRIAQKVIDMVFAQHSGLTAQAPNQAHPIVAIVTVLCVILGLTGPEFSVVAKRCREFTSVVMAGISGTLVLGSLFILLPIALQTALTAKYASAEQKDALLVEDWLARSTALLRLQKIPRVLASDEYFEWCNELVAQVSEIRGKITQPVIVQSYMRNLAGLCGLISTLEAFRDGKAERDYPFALHISAPPGVGKTLVVSRFIRDLFKVTPNQVYPRPLASEFWDSFIPGVKVVLFDEFLIGDKESQNRHASEILEVVSNKKFTPPLASTDNPTVGVKGTECRPVGVITVNNSSYANIAAFNSVTINRRRKAVIEVKIKDDYKKFFHQDEMRLDQLSDKELTEIAWLEFRLVPRIPTFNSKAPWISYAELLLSTQEMYNQHKLTCERIAEYLQQGSIEDATPKEMFDSLLREMRGMPTDPSSPMDEIFNLMSGAKNTFMNSFMNFSAQAPDGKSPPKVEEDSGIPCTPPSTSESSHQMNDREKTEASIPKEMSLPRLKRRTREGTKMRRAVNICHILVDRKKSMEKKNTVYDELVELIHQVSFGDALNSTAEQFEMDRSYLSTILERYQKATEASDDDFQSLSGDSETEKIPPPEKQLSILATIDHANVDPTKLHKHQCHGIGVTPKTKYVKQQRDLGDGTYMDVEVEEFLLDGFGKRVYATTTCTQSFVHKHEGNTVHPMLCKTCITNGWKEDRAGYYTWTMNSYNYVHSKDMREELPQLNDYDQEMMTEEERIKLKCELNRIALDKCIRFGTIPVIWLDTETMPDLPPEYAAYCEGSVKDAALATLKTTAQWVSIFVGMYAILRGVRHLLGNKEDEGFSLESQSLPPARLTRSAPRSRNFQRGQAQAGTSLKFSLEDNVSHHAIPIVGHTFLTYYHSLVKDKERVKDQRITINWNGTLFRTEFSWANVQAIPNDDIAFVTISSKTLPQFPNYVKKFWTEDEFLSFQSTAGYIESDVKKFVTIHKKSNVSYSNGESRIQLEDALIYLHDTMKGDCGLAITSAQLYPGKILGMHVAGGMYGPSKSGAATVITREMVEDALKPKDLEDHPFEEGEPQSPADYDPNLPNLLKTEPVPLSEQIHIPRRSALKHSLIQENLEFMTKKHRPVLSARDPRANGIDPLVAMVTDSLEVDHPDIDTELINEVSESMLVSFERNLKWPIGHRLLTFEEALAGIPGKLSSLKVNSSAGYPLCKIVNKKGKSEFFHFTPNGELEYDPEFRKMVENHLEQIAQGGMDQRRFVAYLKDELISPEKSRAGRCRIIYSGDLVSNVAYRMLFGDILTAFNNSHQTTASAIGLNQYSHDMQSIYDYLIPVGNNFVAGDFKNFDKTIHPYLLESAYQMLMSMANDQVSEIEKKVFVKQQTTSPAQVLDTLVYFKSTHFSGCFFTTIVNNLVNEMMLRYCFAKEKPGLIFDDHVRLKVLGDDHIYNFSDQGRITPFKIRERMLEMGMTYTSDVKNVELKDEFRLFTDLTFLGAHPREIRGQYCGALKKSTLEETILWTRNNNRTIVDEVKMVMELSSIWGPHYYLYTTTILNDALWKSGMEKVSLPGCQEMRRIVASRTSTSEHGYPYGLFAQGPPTNSLATLNESKLTVAGVQGVSQPSFLSAKAVNEEAMALNYGTDSMVFRTEFSWSNTDVVGTPIFEVDVPFGILDLGNPDNLQNMPFDRHSFFEGEVELELQVNSTPFVQGVGAFSFMPLETYQTELANITACEHVLVQPDQSSSSKLLIPMRFYRSVMNTNTRGTPEQESLGKVYFTPLAQLKSAEPTTITLTVYSSFPKAKFSIPRPLPSAASSDTVTSFGKAVTQVDTIMSEGATMAQNYSFSAQGNSSSTQISNTYEIAGNMPVEGGISQVGASSATQDISPEVKIPMPLDNPPLCSGALPVEQAFPGFASSHGIRPTRDLQLKPAALSRQHMSIFGPEETKIQNLLSKKCLWTTMNVSTSQPVGTQLLQIRLDTRMGVAAGSGVPLNLALLNNFFFWHSDIELEFVAVQTRFHSMRLAAVIAFAAPGLDPGSRTVNYSNNMNFATSESGTNYTHKLLIPFNAQTEFLRTYEGDNVKDPIQNYSLGTLGVFIQNSLRANDTVAQNVDVLVFLRFVNSKVAVPRGITMWSFGRRVTPALIESNYSLRKGTAGWVNGLNTYGATLAADGRYSTGIAWRNSRTISIPSAQLVYSTLPTGRCTILANTVPAVNKVILLWKNTANELVQKDVVTPRQINISGAQTLFYFAEDITTPVNILSANSWIFFNNNGNNTYLRWTQSVSTPAIMSEEFEMDLEAQGPGDTTQEIVQEVEGTAENLEVVQQSVVTKTESAIRPNVPCKLELGEKFEFCVSDLTEVMRRYVKRTLSDNDATNGLRFIRGAAQSSNAFRNVINFSNRPVSMFMSLYAAWAGSVKYRLLAPQNSVCPEVQFQPYYNPSEYEIGVIPVDAMSSGGYNVAGTSEATTAVYYTGSSVAGPMAAEVCYPISTMGYADVSVPFQSHFNFCFTQVNVSSATLPTDSGTIALSYTTSDNQPVTQYTLWTAFGDDARLGIFRPPESSVFNPITTTNVGGYRQS